jgi:ABC-2 type transport system ATP-binding protein
VSANPPAGISVRDLTRRYGPTTALAGVSFDVAPGEIVGLLGPNGAGKTTALECTVGLNAPDSGSVFLGGIDARANPAAARERVGVQLQHAQLQDRITPRQALALFAGFYRNAAPVDRLLARTGLVDRADSAFATLSGGERQRLFLALAQVNEPQVLVLDEPTSGLDPGARRGLHDLIRAARVAGRAILFSTHQLDEAQLLCDRVAILDQGRIVATGTPAELVARSRTSPVIAFRSARTPSPATLASLSAHRGGDGSWVLPAGDVTATIAELARALRVEGNEILDLQIRRTSLEEVFLELTGHAFVTAEGGRESPGE